MMGGPIPPPPYQIFEEEESDYRLVIFTVVVVFILVIIDAEFDVATSSSSPARISDVGDEEGEGGALM